MTSARTRDRLVERLQAEGITSPEVLERIRNVPRHLFVDEALASRAYEDTALPIGHGQTISQPYVVARMTEALLEQGPVKKLLEVGTGCGYQTAVVAPLVGYVFGIERITALLQKARQTLFEIGIKNARFRHGDGWQGWQEEAPFDGILVAAAPETVPQALFEQLADGGRLIIPVGGRNGQELLRFTRQKNGKILREVLGLVSFVPLLEGKLQ
jgi:protein-L-isoaspartate(D-aspartate) O-methyltransferase